MLVIVQGDTIYPYMARPPSCPAISWDPKTIQLLSVEFVNGSKKWCWENGCCVSGRECYFQRMMNPHSWQLNEHCEMGFEED